MLVEDWLMDLLKIAEDYKRLLRSMKSGSLPSCSTECPPWAGLCTRAGREPVVKITQAAKNHKNHHKTKKRIVHSSRRKAVKRQKKTEKLKDKKMNKCGNAEIGGPPPSLGGKIR